MDFSNNFTACYFPTYVSGDKDLKAKATEAEKILNDYLVESG
jgi:hypothetical protein